MKNSKKNKILLILILAVLTILVLTSIKIAATIPTSDGKETSVEVGKTYNVNTSRKDNLGSNYPYHLKSKYTFCMEESTRTGRYKEGNTTKYARVVQYKSIEIKNADSVEAYIFYSAMRDRTKNNYEDYYDDVYQKAYWQYKDQIDGENWLLKEARTYAANAVNPNGKFNVTINKENTIITVTDPYEKGFIIYIDGKEALKLEGKEALKDYKINNSDEYAIKLSDIAEEGKHVIKVKSLFKKYTAKYITFKSDGVMDGKERKDKDGKVIDSQPFLVVTASSSEYETKTFTDVEIETTTQVSLQKYITKAGEEELNSPRRNTMAYVEAEWNNCRHTKEIYNDANGNDVISSDKIKKDNSVSIEIGETVEYTIEVYNNENESVDSVMIKDRLPIEIVEYNENNEVTNITFSIKPEKYETDEHFIYFYINVGALVKKETKKFTITVTFNKYNSNLIENRVWIESVKQNGEIADNNKNNNYRTYDSDFVKMKKYAVALEKFVSKVQNGEDGYVIERNGSFQTKINNVDWEYYDWNEDGVVNYIDAQKMVQDIANGTAKIEKENGQIVEGDKNEEKAYNYTSKINKYIAENELTCPEDTTIYEYFAKVIIENIASGAANKYDENADLNEDGGITANDARQAILYGKYIINTWDEISTDEKKVINEKIKNYYKKDELTSTDYTDFASKITNHISNDENGNLTEEKFMDLNEDGKISVADARLAIEVGTEETKQKINCSRGDLNGDGRISVADARLILTKWVANSREFHRDGYKYLNATLENEGNNESSQFNGFIQYATPGNGYVDEKGENSIYDKIKKNNPVSVEPGDVVTYTIKLTNTGGADIKVSQITDTFDSSLEFIELKGNDNKDNTITDVEKDENGKVIINFANPILIEPDKAIGLTIKLKVVLTPEEQKNMIENNTLIQNEAEVTEIKNQNDIVVDDMDGTENNIDRDFVEIYTKTYAVSLEKFVSGVGNTQLTSREGKAEHKYDDDLNTNSEDKYNSPVTVSQDNRVKYTIKVTNNGATEVYITNIADYLPDGIKYIGKSYQGGEYNKQTDNKIDCDILKDYKIGPGESRSFGIVVNVIEPNLSLNILKNVAEITQIKNKNGVEIYDTTQNDNKDADYLQLDYDDNDGKDTILGGTVWNDKALDKLQDKYNGVYDVEKENKLSGIKVQLYRVGKGVIAEKTTDENGKYSFANSDIKKDIVTNSWEQYIKAPKNEKNDRWNDNKKYYLYYVVFEYDGITYTSTPDGTSCEGIINSSKDYKIDSNAREDYGKVKEKRSDFNNKFSVINNESGISYTTKNESEYIPQSNHKYNANTMTMQSSTQLIDFNNMLKGKDIESINDVQEKIKYIGLGLRGRDIFDLELTSDVYSTKVTVNGVDGEYSYNNNKVTVRKSDIPVAEDAANFANEARSGAVSEVNQNLRKTDIKNNAYDVDGDGTKGDTGLHIEVTYKITVKNESATDGTATRIVDYYDSKYSFVKAYNGNGTLSTSEGDSGTGFKSVVITTPGTNLTQSGTMEIYVVLKLNNASATLSSLLTGTDKIPTYNMAEIYEYKTQCAKGQTEYTRGLIDKDSAPGSANKEQVRTTNTVNQNTSTTGGNPTTIGYYFGGNDLSKLKYEDDTYATPTLYFVSSDNQRIINGTVFRDKTTTDSTTKIKTGNGKLDKGEVGVYGATVKLVELATTADPSSIVDNEGTVRYTTTTDKDGKYSFSGFLPGNYVIRYYYGDTDKTVLLYQSDNKNEYSFNGEDYQSTNNTGTYGAAKLNNTNNYWYLYNENDRISTATDNKGRRNQVSEAVTNFTDDQMILLNKIRAGSVTEIKQDDTEGNKIIEKTNMYAHTPSMLLNVEKPVLENGELKQVVEFKDYEIVGMNFGIAEVPVTTIDLQKRIKEFSITDSIGQNILASGKYVNGRWEHTGFVDTLGTGDVTKGYSAQIEDPKLQGAKLQITYSITSQISVERNFDATGNVQPTLKGLVDFVDNDLSYNDSLGDNSKYWELVTDRTNMFSSGATGTVDPDGTKYNEVVKVKADNPILKTYGGETTITLEKELSSIDSTIQDIIKSEVDPYEYSNIVEITGLNYTNTEGSGTSQEDRIRTPKTSDVNTSWMIIRAGIQHDTAISDTLSIIPPTGTTEINTVYYIVITVSLVVLAVGAFGIKKFVLNNKK